MDQTASRILGGVISENENGVCAIDESSNAVGDVAFVTTNDDGSKMVLFRVWQGKGSNMRGFLYTNGAPLKVGSQIKVSSYAPISETSGLPVGILEVTVDSEISKSCYKVYYALD